MDLTRERLRGGRASRPDSRRAPALRKPDAEGATWAASRETLPIEEKPSTAGTPSKIARGRATPTHIPFSIFHFSSFIFLLLLTGCDRLHHQISSDHHGPAWEQHAETPAEPIEGAEQFTADIETVAVHEEIDSTGSPIPDSRSRFLVAARTPHLVQAPCSECHADGKVKKPEGSPRPAHWQITKAHGKAADLTCATCHPSDKPETLRTIHGKDVDLDHSYELCGTCHFEQLRDWKGGAHGKRLGAWSGERVVQNCTGCHDPHDPSFPVREPAIFNPPPEQPGDRQETIKGRRSKVESGEEQ